MESSHPPLARAARKLARPSELLDAALELFVEKGFAATRVEEIAARAGVSKGTVYLYFPSKDSMLRALIAHSVSSLAGAVMRSIAERAESPAILLKEMLFAWVARLEDGHTSGLLKVIVSESRCFPELADFWVREVESPVYELIGRLVREGIECGEFRHVDVHAARHSLILPIVMGCVHRHTLGACAAPAVHERHSHYLRQHMVLVLQGLLRSTCTCTCTCA